MASLRLSVFGRLVGLFVLVSVMVRAEPAAMPPDEWFTRAPTPERLRVLQDVGQSEGWDRLAMRLYAGSLKAYELRQEDAAFAWYLVANWCNLFGQSQVVAGRNWLVKLSEAGGLHQGVDQANVLAFPDEPVARLITADTAAWVMSDRAFSEAFLDLVSPYDCLPRVMAILQALREAEPRRFLQYQQLALAIAVVYDEPPPQHWPHWQVSGEVLPRRLPSPVDAFRFFADTDRAGVSLHKLSTVSAAELKFLVDLAAPFSELVWAQRSVKFPLTDLVKCYEAVRYRMDRVESGQYVWPERSYTLPDIYGKGGICVDQAYFSSQAGKARGVPTLLFSGSGRDGRHAWFGYLGSGQKWVLDAGRYAEQRFVTGVAYDPQSWMPLSDHELTFLSDGFRRLPPYRQSRRHQVFAELYLRLNQKPAAGEAARKAVNSERRNVEAWDLLVASADDQPARAREALYREAAQAMQRYPDLNARFVRGAAESLRARGETSSAEFEERSLVRRGQIGGRSDLGIDQAVALMSAAKADAVMRTYRQVLQQYGRGAGIDFFDRVTRPLVKLLIDENRRAEVQQVIAQTRSVLSPEAGSQLDREMEALAGKSR